MIKLHLPKESYWIDLRHGVRLKVRPLDTAAYTAARFDSQHRVKKIQEEWVEVRAVGGTIEGIPDLTDDAALLGFSQFLFVQSLAKAAIEAWEGVLDGEGHPAPVTAENIDELMRIHSMAEDFAVQYTTTYVKLIQEGEFSATGADGISVAAPDTASNAGR